jgi:hypothetical protein
MTLLDQIYAKAVVLAGTVNETQSQLLKIFCNSALTCLTARLRADVTMEECETELVTASALYALAALSENEETANLQRVQVGDVTLIPGGRTAAIRCLRLQADILMRPYCVDSFVFRRA